MNTVNPEQNEGEQEQLTQPDNTSAPIANSDNIGEVPAETSGTDNTPIAGETLSPAAAFAVQWLLKPAMFTFDAANPEDREKLVYLYEAVENRDLQIVSNINDLQEVLIEGPTEDNFPRGFEIQVQGLRRGQTGTNLPRVLIGMTMFAVPAFETVYNYIDKDTKEPEGFNFIVDAVRSEYSAKIANAVRPGHNETKLKTENLPIRVTDFIANRRRGDDFKTFNEVSAMLINALKKLGLGSITKPALRQVLQSKASAAALYQSIDDRVWQKLLDIAIAKAASDGLSIASLESWKETRETASLIDEVDNITLDNLDNLHLLAV